MGNVARACCVSLDVDDPVPRHRLHSRIGDNHATFEALA